MDSEPISVLFVCLGNICRSTMAEGVFRSLVSKQPYQALIRLVDSCGTAGYHTGQGPDSRTMSTLKEHGINDYTHAARKISASDFQKFDYILAMDEQNLEYLKRVERKNGGKAKVLLFGDVGGAKGDEIEDPYYGGKDGFETAYQKALRFSKHFLASQFPDVTA